MTSKKLNRSEWHTLLGEYTEAVAEFALAERRRELLKQQLNDAIYQTAQEKEA